MSSVAVPPETLTFEDFLEAYDGVHAEWVDGRVFVMSPNSTRHTQLLRFLMSALQYYAEKHEAGEVFLPGMPMRTTERAGREPDVFFVGRERLDLVKAGYLDGPADLVIEIVSPESRNRDRGEKFFEYEKGGVREYWIVDYERKKVEAYRLGADGTYEAVPLGNPAVLRSEVMPGVRLPADWLWQDVLPSQEFVYREWGLM
jgi:Uma2 family endonuclease